MPALDLTDLELETAARACRVLAYEEEQAAKRMVACGTTLLLYEQLLRLFSR